ncbi:DUF4168 domain-containing protein [Sphingomonas soli]|uniref:DUF4168 domain-containing protein n=1 Tax=Sphingomonas soli TaxID=266127 RepID=UPI000831D240|nr:DUF4168 domain-containing protein [Sphingomonas soli]
MQFLSSIALAAALISAPVAFAQTAPQAAPATTPSAAQAAPVTDAEVSQFATAAVAAGKINADAAVPAADKTAKIVEAITATGLTAERFNEIAKAVQADPALEKRVQDAAKQLPAG